MAKQTKMLDQNGLGEKVGKMLITSLITEIATQGKGEFPFSEEEFRKAENSIKSEKDSIAYEIYTSMYNGIFDSFNHGQAMYQQFQNGCFRYLNKLEKLIQAEKFEATFEEYPVILTQKEFNEAKAKARSDKNAMQQNFYDLFFTCLEYFLSEQADVPKAIKVAINETKNKPVTNKRILINYNKDTGNGYYKLSDGSIIHEYDMLMDNFLHQTLYAQELFFRGITAVRTAYKEKTGKEILSEHENELLIALEKLADNTVLNPHTPAYQYLDTLFDREWHYYDEPPTDLTKYDILKTCLDRYTGVYDDISKQEQFNEFKTDYPRLYMALMAYLEETIPPIKGLQIDDLDKNIITVGELLKLKHPVYTRLYGKITDWDIKKYVRGNKRLNGGIAILRGNKKKEYGLNTVEIYKEQLEQKENILDVLITPALKYLYAYNSLLNVLAVVFDIEGIEKAMIDVQTIEGQIYSLNGLLYMLYARVNGDDEEKALKRKIIKELFQPIEAKELKPTQESIDKLVAFLSKDGLTKATLLKLNFYRLLNYLMGEGG